MSDQKTVMREMLANAVHFGHRSSKWDPKMAQYLHGKKNGVHIFDLNKTYRGLDAATEFLTAACAAGKKVLFVSTKQQATAIVREQAERCGMPFVTKKWIPGLLTNFKTIRTRVRYMQKLKEDQASGDFSKYTKKEAGNLGKTIIKLEEALGGVANLDKVPDIVFVLDVCRDEIAALEAKKLGITVVAVCDSNANPSGIDYVIPANDDALKSISYLMKAIGDAVEAGAKKSSK
jgi:small subunit ribosomal protein S2